MKNNWDVFFLFHNVTTHDGIFIGHLFYEISELFPCEGFFQIKATFPSVDITRVGNQPYCFYVVKSRIKLMIGNYAIMHLYLCDLFHFVKKDIYLYLLNIPNSVTKNITMSSCVGKNHITLRFRPPKPPDIT